MPSGRRPSLHVSAFPTSQTLTSLPTALWSADGAGGRDTLLPLLAGVLPPRHRRSNPRLVSCTLQPAPCTLHPAPCNLHPAPCTLHPAPWMGHPTLNPQPSQPSVINLHNPQSSTFTTLNEGEAPSSSCSPECSRHAIVGASTSPAPTHYASLSLHMRSFRS